MNPFDSRRIDIRAKRLLEYHINLLNADKLGFVNDQGSYYRYNEKNEDYFKIGYHKRKKLLSQTFNFVITSVIYNVEFTEDFQLKLQFKGFPHITSASFVGMKTSKKFETLFQDQKLMDALVREAKKVEIGYIRVQYWRAARKLEITVCPYAGAFLWIIFPPVFHDLRLKKDEVKSVYKMAELITKYIKKREDRS